MVNNALIKSRPIILYAAKMKQNESQMCRCAGISIFEADYLLAEL